MEVAMERLLQGESSQIFQVTKTADTINVFVTAFRWRLIFSRTGNRSNDKHLRGEDGG